MNVKQTIRRGPTEIIGRLSSCTFPLSEIQEFTFLISSHLINSLTRWMLGDPETGDLQSNPLDFESSASRLFRNLAYTSFVLPSFLPSFLNLHSIRDHNHPIATNSSFLLVPRDTPSNISTISLSLVSQPKARKEIRHVILKQQPKKENARLGHMQRCRIVSRNKKEENAEDSTR